MQQNELRIMAWKEAPLELLGLRIKKADYLFQINILVIIEILSILLTIGNQLKIFVKGIVWYISELICLLVFV